MTAKRITLTAAMIATFSFCFVFILLSVRQKAEYSLPEKVLFFAAVLSQKASKRFSFINIPPFMENIIIHAREKNNSIDEHLLTKRIFLIVGIFCEIGDFNEFSD